MPNSSFFDIPLTDDEINEIIRRIRNECCDPDLDLWEAYERERKNAVAEVMEWAYGDVILFKEDSERDEPTLSGIQLLRAFERYRLSERGRQKMLRGVSIKYYEFIHRCAAEIKARRHQPLHIVKE